LVVFLLFIPAYKGDGLSSGMVKENGGGRWHYFLMGALGRGMTIEKLEPDAGCRRLGNGKGSGIGLVSCLGMIVGHSPPMFSYVRVRRAKVFASCLTGVKKMGGFRSEFQKTQFLFWKREAYARARSDSVVGDADVVFGR
jgi:hypothetical protein